MMLSGITPINTYRRSITEELPVYIVVKDECYRSDDIDPSWEQMEEELEDQLPNVNVSKRRRKLHHEDHVASKAAVAHSVEYKVNTRSCHRSHKIPETSNEEESESSDYLCNEQNKENENLCTQENSSHVNREKDKHTESKAIYVARLLQKSLQITGSKHEFVCTKCSKTFNNRSNFVRHLLIHWGKKEFFCAICEKRFTLKQSLRAHMKIHSKEKPFSCTECSKPFTDKNNLRRHMLVHNKKSEFSCNTCSKTFLRKQNLENHMLIHADVKPFPCPHCSKTFPRKYNLQRHLHTCEVLNPPESLICSICSKAFPRIYNLKRHMDYHERLYSCTYGK